MAKRPRDDQAGARTPSRWLFAITGWAAAAILVAAVVAFATDSSTAPAGDVQLHGVVAGGPVPVVSGVAREGQTLTAAPSGFARRQAAVLTKWVRCDPTGDACRAIPQAKSLSYRPSAADVGSKIRFEDVGWTALGYGRPVASALTPTVTRSSSPVAAVVPAPEGREASSEETATFGEAIAAWKLRERLGASLLRQLPLRGADGLRLRLLRDGDTTVRVMVLTGGWLSLRYSVPPGEYESKPGPLILTGGATYARAGVQRVRLALTPAGRRILEHRRLEYVGSAKFKMKGHLGYSTEATD